MGTASKVPFDVNMTAEVRSFLDDLEKTSSGCLPLAGGTLTGTLGSTPADNGMALQISQTGSGATAPTGSALSGFNEIFVTDETSVNTAKGLSLVTTYAGSDWGSSNALLEKICLNIEARVFDAPTGTPGPHQVVAQSLTARVAGGIGACPTVELFAANYICLAEEPVHGMIGNEFDLTVGAGGSCVFKIGIGSGTAGANGTDGIDIAFVVGSDAVAKWNVAYGWFSNSISGTIIGPYAGTATNTCVNGIDFSTTTFTGSQIKLAMGASLTNAVNDAAAAGAGVPVGGVYRNGSVLMVRVA